MVEWHHKVLGNNEAKEAEMEEWDMDNDPNPRWMSWEVFHREDRKSLPATVHLPGVPIDRVQRGFTEKEPLLKTFLNERDEDVRDQDEVEEALQKQMAVVSAFQAAVHKESLLSRIAKVFVSSLTKNDRSSHPGGSSSFDCSNKSKPRHTPSGRRIFHVGSMVVISKSMADGLQWASGNGRNRPILGCFAQTLPGRAGVNCMQFGSGEVIVTGGSEKASRSALSSERGWIQVWEVRQGDSAWTLNYTMGENIPVAEKTDSGRTCPDSEASDGQIQASDQGESLYGIRETLHVSRSIADRWMDEIGKNLPPVTAIAIHHHFTLSATGHGSPAGSAKGGGCQIIIWCIFSQKAVNILKGHTHEVTSVEFHPSKPWLLSSAKDSTLRLWNLNRGLQMYSVTAHKGPVTCMKVHSLMRRYAVPEANVPSGAPSTPVAVSSAESRSESFWGSLRTVDEKMKTRMAAKRERIHAHLARMRFTDADREVHEFHMKDCEGKLPENLVATGGTDKAVRLWDAENGKHVRDLLGHEREVNSVAFFKDKSPEQDRLASASFDQTVRIWHVSSGACIRVLNTKSWVLCLDYHKDGMLAYGTAGGEIHLWDDETGARLAKYHNGNGGWVNSVGFMPDSNSLAAVDMNGSISIFEWKSNPDAIIQLGTHQMQAGTTNKALSSHESDASFYRKKSKLVLHPNGALAASIDSHFQVQLLDVATQKVLCVLGKPRATRNVLLRHFVCGLSFHPREPYLAVAGADEIVRIFDIEAGFLCQVLAEHTDRVCCAEFSPSGDILATGGYDRLVILWEPATWRPTRVFAYHQEWVTALAFSPDGHHLASGSWDDKLILNNLKEDVYESKECYSNIWSVSWQQPTCDGEASVVVSAGTGAGMVHYFTLDTAAHPPTWKEAGSFIAHEDTVSSMAWSPCGYFLLTGSLDNSVRLWGPQKTMKSGPRRRKPTNMVPLENLGLFAMFTGAVMSVTWSMQPGSGLGQLSEHGSMVSICTTNAGMYLLDATDAGQPGTPYSRVKFVYDKGGKEALKELIRFSPLSLTSMGPGSRTILHDVIGEVDLLRSLLAEANLNGVSPTMPFGPQPLLAQAYSIPSEPAVEALVDSMLVSESSASASFSSDVGTAALLMLVTGFPEQAARLLASVGLVAANQQVYDDKWREYTPRVRMKAGSMQTIGTFTQYPSQIWGPDTVKKDRRQKEIDVLAACTSFQFAAGIPPGEMRFDGGFTPTSEDLHGNSGLERTLLHLAYNNDAMEIMDTPVGRAILSYKWNTFGKRAYLQSMVWPIGIIFFTTLQSVAWYMVAAYQYKEGFDQTRGLFSGANYSEYSVNIRSWNRLAQGSSIFCFLTALFMLTSEARQIYKEGVQMYLSSGWNQLDLSVIVMAIGSSVVAQYNPSIAQAFTQASCMVAWLEVFNMLRADAKFGLIVRMYLNIARDIEVLIYLQMFLILGSSFSFVGVFKDYSEEIPLEERQSPNVFQDIWHTGLYVYSMVLGNVNLEDFFDHPYGFLHEIMFVLFIYIQSILLMNLIIAMMGESFEKVLQAAQRELTTDRAEVLVRVELTMGVAKMRRRGYLPRYLQVLLPKNELKGQYSAMASDNSEWAGVVGTVTTQMSKKMAEHAERTEATVKDMVAKKTEHLVEQLMGAKKDLKDHLNSLEQRIARGNNEGVLSRRLSTRSSNILFRPVRLTSGAVPPSTAANETAAAVAASTPPNFMEGALSPFMFSLPEAPSGSAQDQPGGAPVRADAPMEDFAS